MPISSNSYTKMTLELYPLFLQVIEALVHQNEIQLNGNRELQQMQRTALEHTYLLSMQQFLTTERKQVVLSYLTKLLTQDESKSIASDAAQINT